MKALLVKAGDCCPDVIETPAKLHDLQRFTGGYIEAVHLQLEGKRAIMFVNEEGKINNLKMNNLATIMAQQLGGLADIIVGDAIVLGARSNGETTDVPQEFVDWLDK